MTLLLGALTISLILSLLALGVFISFRIFHFPDITADGSLPLGAATVAILLVGGTSPFVATAAAFGVGCVAGAVTGVLHTKFRINNLLAGILVMTALYSINLRIMGRSNIPLLSADSLTARAEQFGLYLTGATSFSIAGWTISISDASSLLGIFIIVIIAGLALYAFFRTNLGTAMRATGDNDQMVEALGINVSSMIILGLSLSNGLIALSGALLAQYQGFADIQMGIGMIVLGLASVIIGEALVGQRSIGLLIIGAVMGSILFRLLVAIALRAGLNPNDLKLITAAFVFAALVLPTFLNKLRTNT